MQGMGGKNYTSISIVEPILTKLKSNTLVAKDTDTPVVHELKTDALKNLKKRYKKPEMKSVTVQATLLDPRLKNFLHVALADRADHVDFAKKELLANQLIEKICKPAVEADWRLCHRRRWRRTRAMTKMWNRRKSD